MLAGLLGRLVVKTTRQIRPVLALINDSHRYERAGQPDEKIVRMQVCTSARHARTEQTSVHKQGGDHAPGSEGALLVHCPSIIAAIGGFDLNSSVGQA